MHKESFGELTSSLFAANNGATDNTDEASYNPDTSSNNNQIGISPFLLSTSHLLYITIYSPNL
jgi:hypothetical protein